MKSVDVPPFNPIESSDFDAVDDAGPDAGSDKLVGDDAMLFCDAKLAMSVAVNAKRGCSSNGLLATPSTDSFR